MRVALVQHDIVWEDPDSNHRRLEPRIAAAAAGGATLVLLSEMFATGFSMESDRIAQTDDGPTMEFLRSTARARRIWLGGSLARSGERGAPPTNAFVLAGPGGELVRYDKLHPFSYGGEDVAYSAGSESVTVTVGELRVSLFVCYDLRFANRFWSLAPETDCYLVVANWPASRRAHWRSLLMARAIENQAYVVGVNRVGEGGGLTYLGDSAVVDPMGEVLVAAAGVETTLDVEIDPAEVERTRARFPFIADRRP